jgi:hypothetical protein
MKMNWKNKVLLAFTIFFVFGCASNTPKETNKATKGGAFYAPGTQGIDSSKVATILDKTSSTSIESMGNEKIPHSLFGSQYKKFVTPQGIVMFTISFYDGSMKSNGALTIGAKVEAGKTYELKDDSLSNRISYSLTDVATKQKTSVYFLKKK